MDSNNDDPTSHQAASQNHICKNVTCSFFGNSKFEGYCSVCYKDEVKKRNNSNNTSMNTSMTNSMALANANALNNAAARQVNVRAGISDQIALLEQQCADIDNFIGENPLVEDERVNEINQIAQDLVQQDKDLVEAAIKKSKEEQEQSSSSVVAPKEDEIKVDNTSIVPISTPREDKMTDESPQASPSKKLKNDDNISSKISTKTSKKTSSKPKKRRCLICKCKIGLTGFDCRCGGLFCSTHRYADAHNCSFDYKEDGREKIRKANQKCEDDKIQRF